MSVFKETKENIKEDVKESIFDRVEAELLKKPTYLPKEAPIKALFYGGDGTGKSGTALGFVELIDIEADEKILVVDLDIGNEPACLSYHRDVYERGNLILWEPSEWKEIELPDGGADVVMDYKKTMAKIKAVGIWVKKNWEQYKIRAVILDGLSTLLKHSEWQMRIEKNIDVSGGVTQRYWVTRNKTFLEMLQLYKSIPLDVVFIGNADFAVDPDDKDVAKIRRDTNDLMFQKVGFRVEETPDGKVQFWAKIEKSKQNLKNKGKRIMFAEVDLKNEEADYYWDPSEVIKNLRPDPNAKNKARRKRGRRVTEASE